MTGLHIRGVGPITRTVLFGIVYELAVAGSILFAIPNRELALIWPTAGVGVLWALLVRSAWEAVGATGVILATVGLNSLAVGFTSAASTAVALSNSVVFLSVRIILDLLNRRRPFAFDPEHPPWELRTMRRAAAFVLATMVASALSIPTAYLSLWGTPESFDGDDAIAYFFRNMAAIILIAGTGAAVLDRRAGHRRNPWWMEALEIAAPLLLAAIIFGPAVSIPSAWAMLLPLFWAAVANPPWLAMLYSLYICALVIIPTVAAGSTAVGICLSNQGIATQVHLFCFIAGTFTLVVSTAFDRERSLSASLAEAEGMARDEAERLSTVTATVPDGLAIVYADGSVEPLNESTTGLLMRDAQGRPMMPPQVETPEGAVMPEVERPSSIGLAGGTCRDVPVAVEDEDGRRRIYEVSANPLTTARGRAALLSFGDATERYMAIAERARFEEVLAYQATHDPLTGLRNRAGFGEEIEALNEVYTRTGEDSGVIAIDLDHFKNVNDTLGHSAGDALLVEIAAVISSVTRGDDIAARLGGDEFAILLRGAPLSVVRNVGERLVAAIARRTQDMTGEQRRVTASIGATTLSIADRMGLQPMMLADMLVYEAKASGRNGLATVDGDAAHAPSMVRDLALAERVRGAIERGDFHLHLQPISDTESGAVQAVEALLRLDDGGPTIGPGAFMPVVERNGMSVDVDAWVFREAIRVRALLDERMPAVRLAVNVSGPSVGDARFQAILEKTMAENPAIAPASLILEITETASVADMDRAAAFTRWARRMGFGVSLDDFGAGFGSLAYVKRLEFDYLKIEGSFVRRADADSTDRSIVAAIVAMARDLGKRTIGEYVENRRVWSAARELGVDCVQGYEISEPLPVEEFLERFSPSASGPR